MTPAPAWLTYLNSLLVLIGPFVGAALAHWYAAYKAGKGRDARIRALVEGFGDSIVGNKAATDALRSEIRLIVVDELARAGQPKG